MLISENKIKHCHSVAEYMYENASKYNLDPDDMYLLGLLHDIGYIYGYEGHPEKGAKILCKNRFPLAWAVAWHEKTPREYMEYTKREDVPKALVLLWEADLSVDIVGNVLGFDGRLEDIKTRYGEESIEYRNSVEIVNWLKETQEY